MGTVLAGPPIYRRRQVSYFGTKWPCFKTGLTFFTSLSGQIAAQVLERQAQDTSRGQSEGSEDSGFSQNHQGGLALSHGTKKAAVRLWDQLGRGSTGSVNIWSCVWKPTGLGWGDKAMTKCARGSQPLQGSEGWGSQQGQAGGPRPGECAAACRLG